MFTHELETVGGIEVWQNIVQIHAIQQLVQRRGRTNAVASLDFVSDNRVVDYR